MKKELNRDEMEKYFDQKYDGWVCDCGIVSTTILMIYDKSTKTQHITNTTSQQNKLETDTLKAGFFQPCFVKQKGTK